MKEANTHICGFCKYYVRDENIKPIQIGVNFLNRHAKGKKRGMSQRSYSRILTNIASHLEIGYITCGDKEEIVGSSNTCDKENMYNPRRNLKYWFLIIRNTANQVARVIPRF
ncbi:MAG: hypothetical protein WCV81_02575 [Microgenomates group bacterium]|jgi:hypothetical protein